MKNIKKMVTRAPSQLDGGEASRGGGRRMIVS